MKKTIMVTGGSGFLGSHVVEKLNKTEKYIVYVPRSDKYDLTQRSCVNELFSVVKPDIVVHLAAKVGGIGANRDNPGSFFYDNIMMGLNLVDASKYMVKKFIHIGTVCSYPKYCEVPFKETSLWNGFPEETNAPYGIAKKAIITMLEGYKKQYDLSSMVLMPVNLYGPRDNFNENSSHVIPALIKKIYDAKNRGDNEIVCWGTGKASREFLYVDDAADAIVRAIESDIDDQMPINLGGSGEITIERLVRIISEHMCYTGKIVWDDTKPDGQPRRCLDNTRCQNILGWKAKTDFVAGIRETIKWYKQNH